ncbi:hypothetical protein ABPG72_002736 [Tetrahymena utriculariae]
MTNCLKNQQMPTTILKLVIVKQTKQILGIEESLVRITKMIQELIVAFRGTDQIENWLSNLNFVPVKYLNNECKNFKVHQGFVNIFNSILYDMKMCVIGLKKQYNSTSILVTGHSLGGFMAILFSLQVGNLEFVNYANQLFGKNSFRLVNEQGIVPHLPYNTIGFQHIRTEYWLNDQQDPLKYQICSSSVQGESSMCANSKSISLSVKDHLNYFRIYYGCSVETQQEKEAEKQDQKKHE